MSFQHFTKGPPLKQPSDSGGVLQAGAPEIIKGSHNPEAREMVRVSMLPLQSDATRISLYFVDIHCMSGSKARELLQAEANQSLLWSS